jgi:ABC-type siderophore export system fused ATPase/permease subunit
LKSILLPKLQSCLKNYASVAVFVLGNVPLKPYFFFLIRRFQSSIYPPTWKKKQLIVILPILLNFIDYLFHVLVLFTFIHVKGQVLGLVGTNGIGKSTALKILAGKLKPNLGRFNDPPDVHFIPTHFKLVGRYFEIL